MRLTFFYRVTIPCFLICISSAQRAPARGIVFPLVCSKNKQTKKNKLWPPKMLSKEYGAVQQAESASCLPGTEPSTL